MDTRPNGATTGTTFRGQALLLRGRSGLTQRELATLIGVSERAVQKWEAGLGHPSAVHLQRMIAVYMQRAIFTAGRELEEAAALWTAAQLSMPFDQMWFDTLHGVVPATRQYHNALPSTANVVPALRQDWDAAPHPASFHGRDNETATITNWLLVERCRLIAVLGQGGIGKSALVARVARALAPRFEAVFWRSLRNALPVDEWMAAAIQALSPTPTTLPPEPAARLALLLALLRAHRGLLILDNLETVLQSGEPALRYREGYEGYGTVLQALGERAHQGCLLLTSREEPPEFGPLAGEQGPVQTLRLDGLGLEAGATLLRETGLVGEVGPWAPLVRRYGGNPLALKVVGQTIVEMFGGDVSAYLAYLTTAGGLYGELRLLLEQQFARLSVLEKALAYWLAVEREPVEIAALVADLGQETGRAEALEALHTLKRRSLLEQRAKGMGHTLQPVVLEYVSERLVSALAQEIATAQPMLLQRHAVLQATAKDYVRQSQERLLARPLLQQLIAACGDEAGAERRLLDLLEAWRHAPPAAQGYGPGTAVNLLRLLRGHLRGLDLSHLAIRQAYLADVEAQDASLASAHLSDAVLAEAFTYPLSVALSADGASMAVGMNTGEVCLWRVADRALLLAVQEHAGPILGMALSGDGQLLASSSDDTTVKLWETDSGRLLATLQGHSAGVWGVALSTDGRLVASGSFDGTVKLWEAPSGRLLATLQGHAGWVRGVALSRDGLLASGHFDGSVKLWEVPGGRLLATLQGHCGPVHDVAISGDGHLVASSSVDGTVRLWDTASARELATLQGHSGGVWGVALSTDGRLVASGDFGNTIKLWEAPGGRLLATLQGHSGLVHDVALSGDGHIVASSSFDGTVKLWEARGGQLLTTLHGYTGGVHDVALSEDGGLVASGGFDGTVKLWDTASGRLLGILRGHSAGVYGVTLSGDGQLVASGSFDSTVKLWEARSGRLLATLPSSDLIHDVALSGDGRLVAGGGDNRTVKLWETATGRLLASLEGHSGPIRAVAISRDGRLVASGSFDETVRLWDATSGRLLFALQGHTGPVYDVELSGDGRLVASGSFDGTVKLWDTSSGRLLETLQGYTRHVYGVAFGGDGQLVAAGGFDGTVKLWEARSGRLLASLSGHTSLVHGVALSGNGRLVASGSFDGTIKLWEARTGTCLRTLREDRPYERLDITGLTGITQAQRRALLVLGAVERNTT